MIDIRNIRKVLLFRLGELPIGHALEVRTYKRNRSVLFARLSDDQYFIRENGYETRESVVPATKLSRTIKTLLKREFPRSNKVRLYTLGEFDPAAEAAPNRKKL